MNWFGWPIRLQSLWRTRYAIAGVESASCDDAGSQVSNLAVLWNCVIRIWVIRTILFPIYRAIDRLPSIVSEALKNWTNDSCSANLYQSWRHIQCGSWSEPLNWAHIIYLQRSNISNSIVVHVFNTLAHTKHTQKSGKKIVYTMKTSFCHIIFPLHFLYPFFPAPLLHEKQLHHSLFIIVRDISSYSPASEQTIIASAALQTHSLAHNIDGKTISRCEWGKNSKIVYRLVKFSFGRTEPHIRIITIPIFLLASTCSFPNS